ALKSAPPLVLFLSPAIPHTRHLHSFPTRRSSDLFWISAGVPGTVYSIMLTRSGRSAKRCAARKSISRRLSSGPPVWRKLATRHDSRRSPLATTSSACDSTPTSFANRTPATHTFSEEGAAWFGRAEG